MMNGQNGTGEKVQDAAHDVAKELGELGRELREKANSVRERSGQAVEPRCRKHSPRNP